MTESKLVKALDILLIPSSTFRAVKEMRKRGVIKNNEIGEVYENLIPAEIARVGLYFYLAGNAIYSLVK